MPNRYSTLCFTLLLTAGLLHPADRDHVAMRGIYGGSPIEPGSSERLAEWGLTAVFLNSGRITTEIVEEIHAQGGRIFAEFNTMHHARYLDDHPEAAPIGPDGAVSPPPRGWQGICPSHEGYRQNRMAEFRRLLTEYELDGIWLDYHHAHASWERADPVLPDTCFCHRCLAGFQKAAGIEFSTRDVSEISQLLLTRHREEWIRFRADLFTDWVREFRQIIDAVRPEALLGTFHAPWTDEDHNGARLEKLAIDLKAQAEYLDVFSPMPYHARFGHADEVEWISRQVSRLGRYLGIEGKPDERKKIWPIVQLSNWGKTVPASQVEAILDHAARLPATGVMVFAWGSLREEKEKLEQLRSYYLRLAE